MFPQDASTSRGRTHPMSSRSPTLAPAKAGTSVRTLGCGTPIQALNHRHEFVDSRDTGVRWPPFISVSRSHRSGSGTGYEFPRDADKVGEGRPEFQETGVIGCGPATNDPVSSSDHLCRPTVISKPQNELANVVRPAGTFHGWSLWPRPHWKPVQPRPGGG